MTLQNAAAQVAELIRTYAHGGHAHVVGLSLGAQTVIELLSPSPEVIHRAIASGPLMRPLPGIHNWSLQLPDLFVQAVRAWITGQALPAALVQDLA